MASQASNYNLDSVPEGIRSNEIFKAMIQPVTASPAGCLLSGGSNAVKIGLAVQELEAKYIATFQMVHAKFPNVYNAVVHDLPDKAEKLKDLMRSLFNYETGAWDVYMLETLFILCKNWVATQPALNGGTASATKMTMAQFKSKLFESPDTAASASSFYWNGLPLGDAFTLFEGMQPCININKAGEPEDVQSSIFCELCSTKINLNSAFNVANIRAHAATSEHMSLLAAHRRGAALMWYAITEYPEGTGPPNISVPSLEDVETVPNFLQKFKARQRKRQRTSGSQSRSQNRASGGGRSQDRNEGESEEPLDSNE